MPTSAEIHIQKMAPGPPAVIAVATPTMLPVPMVPASAVASAWNWEIAPGSRRSRTSGLRKMAKRVPRSHSPNRRNWKKPVPTVK